jgi:uncharacterized membrane protein
MTNEGRITMKRLGLLALLSVMGFGCTNNPAPTNIDCNGTPPTFEQVTAFSKCKTCHDSSKTGAARLKAPPTINFDTAAAAEAQADKAVSEVMKGDMPPRNSGLTLTDSEKQQFYEWAMCMN